MYQGGSICRNFRKTPLGVLNADLNSKIPPKLKVL